MPGECYRLVTVLSFFDADVLKVGFNLMGSCKSV